MPNTNPSDLDRDDWVASVFVSNHGVDMDLEAHIACKLPDGVHKLYARPALPRASGVPEAEAVAWRYRWVWDDKQEWFFSAVKPNHRDKIAEPLFASPPPVAAPSGEAGPDAWWLEQIAACLDREGCHYLAEEARDFAARAAPPSPIASEHKDAGNV